jgi:hypothetical protein
MKQQRHSDGQFKSVGKADSKVSVGLSNQKSIDQWSERARSESRVYYKPDGTQAKVRATPGARGR